MRSSQLRWIIQVSDLAARTGHCSHKRGLTGLTRAVEDNDPEGTEILPCNRFDEPLDQIHHINLAKLPHLT